MRITVLADYQAFVAETAIFQPDRGISYCIGKLNGEVGEIADKLYAIVRNGTDYTDAHFRLHADEAVRRDLLLEIGDVFWYVTALGQQIGVSIGAICENDFDVDLSAECVGRMNGITLLTSALRLSALAGGISEKAGKIIRDQNGDGTNTSYLNHRDYITFVVHSLVRIVDALTDAASVLDAGLFDDVVPMNMEKLNSRRKRKALSGSGDHR